ncbi:hypothetical protein CO2235_U990005 [Cupriavidus oxalaticus]|uniref:Uncharacterized protein n=1 Tax=Cupriavidus oxalaticus TaxID=96344 RepID=A0A375FVU6_9BURK|nr:hypothetical protein CO2235_U990005 [Cupriavidus oxalaticus]
MHHIFRTPHDRVSNPSHGGLG